MAWRRVTQRRRSVKPGTVLALIRRYYTELKNRVCGWIAVCAQHARCCAARRIEPRIYWAHERTDDLPERGYVAMQVRAQQGPQRDSSHSLLHGLALEEAACRVFAMLKNPAYDD